MAAYNKFKSDDPQYSDVPWVHRILLRGHEAVSIRSERAKLQPELFKDLCERAAAKEQEMYQREISIIWDLIDD